MARQKTTTVKTVATKRRPRRVAKKPYKTGATTASLYSVHPGVAMVQKWIADLPAKTGRSLDDWLVFIRKCGPKDQKACHQWLKSEHQLGTNTAGWMINKAFGNVLGLADDTPQAYLRAAPRYVAEMYAGPKVLLRPIHDELVRLARLLGSDVRICPCQTIVPLYRHHVFGQIKPTTQKRIDLGLALGEEPFTSRLLDTGGRAKKDRITHRVALGSLADIDLQVKRWLKQAYDRDV